MASVNTIPLSLPHSPESVFRLLLKEDHPLFLDSRDGPNARVSLLTCRPSQMVRNTNTLTEKWTPETGWETSGEGPLELMRRLLARRHAKCSYPGFTGAFGYISYDFGRQIENLPEKNTQDIPISDLYFGFYDTVLAFDHATREWTICWRNDRSRDNAAFWEKLVRKTPPDTPLAFSSDGDLSSNLSEPQFQDMVNRTKEYILAGDVFQVNLSQRLCAGIQGNPYALYRKLMKINPSPFSSFLKFDDLTIASSSPERLFKISGNRIEARPIAGTRRRGKDLEEDSVMYEELIHNEKERAEHLMLVDLVRNDIGRVSKYGSVHVTEFMIREAYSHVWHLVSNVAGELLEGRDALDGIRATFPGGTITGAPKVRAMEIIEELEPVRRGLYTGAIGYIADNGDCDLDIVIRTFVIHKNKAYIQVGAGIVSDSDPHREYRETFNKAEALLKALDDKR